VNLWFQLSVASADRAEQVADLDAKFLLSLATGVPLWVRSIPVTRATLRVTEVPHIK
jgi:hypothetical protein